MNITKTRFIGLTALVALLAGCASGPVYRPAAQPGDYGYRDTMLTHQHYRVSFSGGYGTARETVDNFALFRAAQVALSHGADHFRVVSWHTSPITESTAFGPTASIGYGYPLWSTGFGYSTGSVSRTRYESVLQIQIGADVPDQGPHIYNARQIKQNLSPEVAAVER
ncbi:CC0125/CC1285 family lipoprotein [Salinisphaera sp.]|uniref:CC0125/CC1285 family lipoprotein n=1 Tax=Salinisphaera sp. TaxID=1914330 RepID=UPI002D766A32|nr:hypothetical protein [Salinisphaera sp.]HET7315188.1 hypothetical protein [Salinisphaera sp.]